MTTDERIDRLVERHEALTLSVEMLQHEIRDLKEAAASLLHVAEIHEARISRLEGEEGDEATQ
jgi:prefoldin subunit 5